MNNNNIFLSITDKESNISGKITYTSVIESIPNSKVEKQIDGWQKNYSCEYRWRFMKDKERHIVEISKTSANCSTRLYYNKYGEWVKRNISEDIDKFVVKEYFVYTNE